MQGETLALSIPTSLVKPPVRTSSDKAVVSEHPEKSGAISPFLEPRKEPSMSKMNKENIEGRKNQHARTEEQKSYESHKNTPWRYISLQENNTDTFTCQC